MLLCSHAAGSSWLSGSQSLGHVFLVVCCAGVPDASSQGPQRVHGVGELDAHPHRRQVCMAAGGWSLAGGSDMMACGSIHIRGLSAGCRPSLLLKWVPAFANAPYTRLDTHVISLPRRPGVRLILCLLMSAYTSLFSMQARILPTSGGSGP